MKFLTFVILSALASQPAAHAGFEVGNGGDVVFCDLNVSKETNNGVIPGWNLLDVVVNYGVRGATYIFGVSEIYPTRALLGFPSLLESFRKLIESERLAPFGVTTDPQRIWRKARFGLSDIKDEALIENLPPSCGERGGDPRAKPKLYQVVVREKRPGTVIYNYDPEVLAKIRKFNNLSYSYLLVHEWLWDFCPDARVNRDINAFLHSRQSESMTPGQIKDHMTSLGFVFPSTP